MPVFAYRGLGADGRTVNGVVDADSARTARGKLRASGIFPTDLNEESNAAERKAEKREWFPSLFRRKLPAAELALLTRQLSALLGAGVPLVEALGALSDQSARAATKRMFSQVRERVREGSSLADALASHRDTFSDLYIGMVRAGEQAAALEGVLDRLAEYSERQSEFTNKVRGALTYPIIMMFVGAGVMGFLVTYVVPQVATIFEEQKAALPLATRILLDLSALVTGYWLAAVAVADRHGRRYRRRAGDAAWTPPLRHLDSQGLLHRADDDSNHLRPLRADAGHAARQRRSVAARARRGQRRSHQRPA